MKFGYSFWPILIYTTSSTTVTEDRHRMEILSSFNNTKFTNDMNVLYKDKDLYHSNKSI